MLLFFLFFLFFFSLLSRVRSLILWLEFFSFLTVRRLWLSFFFFFYYLILDYFNGNVLKVKDAIWCVLSNTVSI